MTRHTRVIFTIQFGPTRSPAFATALRLARQADGYTNTPDGVHRAEFTLRAESLATLAALWRLVRPWKTSELWVQGMRIGAREGWAVRGILDCLARALTFDPPARYCASLAVPSAQWPGRPDLPCRLFALSGFVHLLDRRVDWADPVRRPDQLRAFLLERSLLRCPLLQQALGDFEAALAAWRPPQPRSGAPSRPMPRTVTEFLLWARPVEDPTTDESSY